jgi:hypothetical protein
MAELLQLKPSLIPAPPAAISRVLATFDRKQLAGFIAVAIDLLDLADGDSDEECELVEDDFFEAHPYLGPGCPITDPGGGNVEDEGEPDEACH